MSYCLYSFPIFVNNLLQVLLRSAFMFFIVAFLENFLKYVIMYSFEKKKKKTH